MVKHVFDKKHDVVSYTFPMFLYRYQRVDERFFSALEESYLWFSPPPAQNDPFDCANVLTSDNSVKELTRFWKKYVDPNPRVARQHAVDLYSDDEARAGIAKELYERRIGHVNLCCFSTSPTVSLLWAHYADGHRGAVVIYSAYALVHATEGPGRFAIVKVRYQRHPPRYNTIRELLKYGDSAEYHARFDQTVLGTKGSEWAYEQETRLISSTPGENIFKKEAFVGIICGHKMPMEAISEVNYRVYTKYPGALIFYQQVDNITGAISVPGTEAFENQTIEIKPGGWLKMDDQNPHLRSAIPTHRSG